MFAGTSGPRNSRKYLLAAEVDLPSMLFFFFFALNNNNKKKKNRVMPQKQSQRLVMAKAFASDRAISQEHKGQRQQYDPSSVLLSIHVGL